MGGKIAGIAATGLTMVGTWAITFIIAVGYLPQLLGVQSKLNISAIASNPIYLASFLIYFLLGYLFYAAVLVAIGSLCDNLKDAQNASSPVTMMLFIPMLLMIPVGRDPNGIIARVFSYLPPFTPFAMMNRAAGPPPMIDYILTTLLLIVSIILTTWAAAKIFRTGILLTGKPPSIREVLRWLKAPVGSAKPSQK
jgi:ABC-2 type transport system permease protein